MLIAARAIAMFVALQHLGFLVLEMFLWTKPVGRKVFRTTPEFAQASSALAANQGLYNGFLAAGLIWGLWQIHAAALPTLVAGDGVVRFFLHCVFVAGVFGGFSVNTRILWIQALPAAIAEILYVLVARG
jgi:putative membrane protein